ncbi:MAG: hypothetical protein H5U40_17480 [Polyangiaceae bacterium]|nr:hypothetical protein [Polyangiaceae bacterium]
MAKGTESVDPTARAPRMDAGDARRLEVLRERAQKDRAGATDAAWDWLTEFQSLETHHRLPALFAEGTAPTAPDGDCEGMVLGLYGAPWLDGVDRLVRIGRFLGGIGWTGKSFDPQTGRGFNRLTTSSRIPMFLAMPTYRFERTSRGELHGFRFDHRIEASPLSPDQDVLAVVYARPEYGNPLVLPNTRDELVEIVPSIYLGRALLHEDDRWRVVGYFALRHPVRGRR